MPTTTARSLRLALALLWSTHCFATAVADTAPPAAISPQAAATLSGQRQAVILDVREDDEWRQRHIENAIHIPLPQLPARLAELEPFKNTLIITQCRSGRRSAQAAALLKSAGFTQVHNLEGGLLAWQKAGLPVK